jgi:hypothetical protein
MTALADAKHQLDGIDPDLVAGFITTTKVPDIPTPADTFRRLLDQEGLDGSLVPNKRREADDFANACRAVETRRGKAAKGERVAVGEVLTNQAESIYQITREVVDAQNKVIDHEKAMKVVLDNARPTDPLRFELLDPSHEHALKPLEDQIRARFFALRGTLPGAKVRAILRELFKQMNATRWSSANSVWFVAPQHADKLEAIERVLAGAYGADAEFDLGPILNTKAVRERIKGKVGQHVSADATKLMADIAEKLQGDGDVRPGTFELVNGRARELREHADQMRELLGVEVETADEALKLVDQQLLAMWGRVKVT